VPTQIITRYLSDSRSGAEGDLPPNVLIAEANHRIANNLTLIAGMLHLRANQLGKAAAPLSPREAKLMLAEVSERIQTVGRLHRLLAAADGEDEVNLADYLRDIAAAAIESMAPDGEMTLSYGLMTPCHAPPQRALLIGFVLGELVTNAVKYAHPSGVRGRIEMSCERRPDGAVLIRVSDDGVGLPEGFNPRRDGGLGMRTVRLLTDQLGATLTFSSEGMGLTARLLAPLTASAPRG